ncbi:hypothetical protein M0Q50_04520 [bacterium]|jgi:hypothetical protein|nr:hypothetical protein [bacterium]
MKKFSKILEQQEQHDNILIIVDVQKEFEEFIQNNLVDELNKYAQTFSEVYQIWDSNKASKPSYTFPNEKAQYVKKYGTTFSRDLEKVRDKLKQNYTKEGDLFRFSGMDSYIVRVKNNHGFFYIPEDMANFFKTIKGKKVIVVGGAFGECIKDVFEALESFGVFPQYNKKYIYSAKTSNSDTIKNNN